MKIYREKPKKKDVNIEKKLFRYFHKTHWETPNMESFFRKVLSMDFTNEKVLL